ncbi:hypothetical protein MAXJ12_36311, partial [Mesorhizobium alhagi CCNWXJ12-2]
FQAGSRNTAIMRRRGGEAAVERPHGRAGGAGDDD